MDNLCYAIALFYLNVIVDYCLTRDSSDSDIISKEVKENGGDNYCYDCRI